MELKKLSSCRSKRFPSNLCISHPKLTCNVMTSTELSPNSMGMRAWYAFASSGVKTQLRGDTPRSGTVPLASERNLITFENKYTHYIMTEE